MSLHKHAWVVFALSVVSVLPGCEDSSSLEREGRAGSVEQSLAPGTALVVVGNTNLNAGDNAVSQRLQALGFTVVLKTDSAAVAADATGKSLVVISSTSTSGNVGTKFRSVAVPVLLWESALLDDMGMVTSGSQGIVANQTRAKLVVASTDPMSAGLTGSQGVVSGVSTFSWGTPAPQAVVVAQLDTDASKAAVFRYEKGSAMVGLNAPERRVGMFLEDATASLLTSSGQALLDAAIRWAANVTAVCTPGTTQCGGNGVQTCSAGGVWGPSVNCANQMVCVAGACTSACTPGTTQCGGNGVQTCSAGGVWGPSVNCANQMVCVAGACTSTCTPGTTQCGGNGVQTCSAGGVWGPSVNCANQMVCVAGACTSTCTPGTTQCGGNGVQTCSAGGVWGPSVSCPNQTACVAGACTGVCSPGATQCSGTGVQICGANGTWGAPIVCGNP